LPGWVIGTLFHAKSQRTEAQARQFRAGLWYKRSMQDQGEILIFGAGGHGKAVIDLARTCGYHVAALVDDSVAAGTRILDVEVVGGVACLPEWRERGITRAANAVGGIGQPGVRQKIFEALAAAGFSFPTLIHPRAWIEASAQVEDGVQVLALAYVGSAARLGFGSVINVGAIVSHDVNLGRVTNLSPGAALAGGVQLGDYSQVGMNATINVNIQIGEQCIIGNGATVKAAVPYGTRVWAGSTWPLRNT
jgi:sugar O-acyltransferase (sialic acid O-acetyltransferase NeuD family)